MAGLLSLTANGALTTTELIRRSAHSPNTIVRYMKDLEQMGLIERIEANKTGVGRNPVVIRVTRQGMDCLHQLETSFFRKLSSTLKLLWGPRKSLSYWGIPFYGRADVFSPDAEVGGPFEIVVETRTALYEGPVEHGQDRYPSLESLIAWAARSGNPRFAGAAARMLQNPQLQVEALIEKASRLSATNSVGYLASIAGVKEVVDALNLSPSRERMLSIHPDLDDDTARLAKKWNVTNPVSVSSVKEVIQLYGGT